MPLPLARLVPIALRLGAFAAAGLAARRWVRARSFPGRTDQRAEDALDDLVEGVSLHRPQDRADDRQTNASARLRRVVRFRGHDYELDAGFVARVRLRQRTE